MHVYKTYLKDVIMRLLIYVSVNDVIILLILTTRPKEEKSNAFHYPPEVPTVNDRLLVSMNHLGQCAPYTVFKIKITASL